MQVVIKKYLVRSQEISVSHINFLSMLVTGYAMVSTTYIREQLGFSPRSLKLFMDTTNIYGVE